jgi:hypothetical protein
MPRTRYENVEISSLKDWEDLRILPFPYARIDNQFVYQKPTADLSTDVSRIAFRLCSYQHEVVVGTLALHSQTPPPQECRSTEYHAAAAERPGSSHPHAAPRALRPPSHHHHNGTAPHCAKLGIPSTKLFVPGRPKREAPPKMIAGLCAAFLLRLGRAPFESTDWRR